MTWPRRPTVPWLAVGLLSLALGLYTSLPLLEGSGWNPSVFIKFPEAHSERLAYGREMLGDVLPTGGQGHDGKFFFMQAMDPFYLQPQEHARFLDRPSYRAQRMLYPAVAGGFGLFPPEATAWSLWAVNMALLFAGGFLTARLANAVGISPWFGLAFAFNPGVIISALIDTADVMAMVLFIVSVLMMMRRRYVAAAVFLALAALTRETMILAALGSVAYLWKTERKVPAIFALPLAVTAAWWLYLRAAIGHLDQSLQDTAALGFPFRGFAEAVDLWLTYSGTLHHMLFGFVLLGISLLVLRHAIRAPTVLGYMTAGFTLIAITMTSDVWKFYFDASRALIPVATAYVLIVPGERKALGPGAADVVSRGDRTRHALSRSTRSH